MPRKVATRRGLHGAAIPVRPQPATVVLFLLWWASSAFGVLEPATPRTTEPPALAAPLRATRFGSSLPARALPAADPRSKESVSRLSSLLSDDADGPSLELVDVRSAAGVTYERYRQVWSGCPVLGSAVTVARGREGAATSLHGLWFRTPPPMRSSPASAAVTAEAARQVLEAELRASGSDDAPFAIEWKEVELVWLPRGDPDQADPARAVPALTLTWRLVAVTEGPPGRWEGWIDARTGDMLARLDRTAYAGLSGTIRGSIEPITAGDLQEIRAFPYLAVQATQQNTLAHDTTDAQGRFRLTVPADGPARVTAELKGSYAWIRDVSLGLFTPFDTLTANAPGSADLLWVDGNSTIAARDAFYHVNLARAAIRALDQGPALAPLDQPMQVRVDDPTGACNAYWNGSRLNFYAGGSGCVAAARVADVVYHEFGHAVTDLCYAPFMVPGDMNEAFSDYFATTLTDQPFVGTGFYGPNTRIRDVERDRIWPRDANPSVHQQGLILAGALWDLRKELGAPRTDALFHFARYGAAQTFDEYLLDVLSQDDDDGNLDNGTPHFGAIIRAFRAHGIGDYSVRIEHERLPDLEAPPSTIRSVAAIRSLLPLAPDSLGFYYSTGGEYIRLQPDDTGIPRQFQVELDTPPAGTAIRYYWAAADTAGNRATLPAGAPANHFTFVVGPDRIPPTVQHDPLGPATAGVTRLSFFATVSDNSDHVGAVRAIVRRQGEPDSLGVDLAALEGTALYRGEPALPAPAEGDTLFYRIVASDLAREPNQTRWPQGGSWWPVPVRRGWTATFEGDPGGLTPDGGWTWGSPAAPYRAWSGMRVWGVVLSGAYPANCSATLTPRLLDLRGWERARLQFRHLYLTETGYDGGCVEWSFGEHGPWTPLAPAGGYPLELVHALGTPGYSGDSGGWSEAVFPLDRFVGSLVWIRFRFESDARLEGRGWFLDDLAMIGSQARCPARSLRAQECGATCVHLSWEAPLDIDTTSTRFQGYRLTRAGNGLDSLDLSSGPIRSRQWVDEGLETGATYWYRLRAVYDEGESPGLEAVAAPFAPAMDLNLDEVVYELRGTTAGDTAFLIQNATGGTLRFNAYLGDSSGTLESLRLRHHRGSPEVWHSLWEGGDPGGDEPRVIQVATRDREDAEIGPVMDIRLRLARPWGEPEQEGGGLIWIDTDDNLATGRADANLGAEYLVAFGTLAHDAGFDGPAVLLNPYLRPLEGLTGALLPAGSDSILLVVPWQSVGLPSDVRLKVVLADSLSGAARQEVPVPSAPLWLGREPRHGRAEPGHPQPFELTFDASAIGNGAYRGVLVLESNDAQAPSRRIPITLRVRDLLPSELLDLRFVSADRGMQVSFRFPTEPRPIGVSIERSAASPVRWSQLTNEPLAADSSGVVRFEDQDVEPGRSYLYRFRVGFEPQRFVTYGPHAVTYLPAVPARLWLSAPRPNPSVSASSHAIELRADIPEPGPFRVEVFDLSGRRLRRLLEGTWAAGPHWIRWDGRDDDGRDVPTGSYWMRLSTERGSRATRAVILH